MVGGSAGHDGAAVGGNGGVEHDYGVLPVRSDMENTVLGGIGLIGFVLVGVVMLVAFVRSFR